MKRKMRCPKSLIPCLLAAALVFAVSGSATAEDVDVYKANVKNNAHLVLDTSGSMSWPVYNSNHNYAAFMRWMRDPNGDGSTADALAYDQDDCIPFGTGMTRNWWDASWDGVSNNSPTTYDRLDPNRVYLVTTYVNHRVITYTDSGGTTKSVSAIDDIMWNTGTETDAWNNKRYPLLSRATFLEARSSAGTPWSLDDLSSIETITVNGETHVVFPSGVTLVSGLNPDPAWSTITNNYSGVTLPNHQDIVLSKPETDPRTNVVVDRGFVGFLKDSGFYFAGVFEHSTSHIQFTDDPSQAQYANGGYRVYLFATGNFLNFIKLVEDFRVDGLANATCSYNLPYTYGGTQRYMAWRSICDKSGTADAYTEATVGPYSQGDWGVDDYGRPKDETVGTFNISAYGPVKSVKIYFETLDVENSTVPGCDCWNTDSQNDGVYLVDQNGNTLTMATDPDTGIYETTSGKLYGCDASGWTGAYDVTGVTSITVKFYVASNGAHNCGGTDRGFRITKIKYSTADPSSGETTDDFICCNGDDGVGMKIKSRMDVAKKAMKYVIDDTRDKLNWGLTRFNAGDGGTVLAPLGTGPDNIISIIDGINPGGSTPLGEAIQDAYNSNYSYLNTHTATAECSYTYIIAMTDGFPTSDASWSRINDGAAENYPNPTFNQCAAGYGACAEYGDADTWLDDNHTDDVAHWLYNEATHKHTVHSIAFGLNNPMLGDVADSSAGIYITAYNEQQVINAFYSLGLAMVTSVAFTAPVVSVDEANRTQSGDELYMAFFKPENGDYWKGNLKKYGLLYVTRTDCSRTEPEWTVVDKDGTIAGNCDGTFKTTTFSYWSTAADGGEVDKGGAGDKLMAKFNAITLGTPPYYDFRRIYTYVNGAIERVIPTNTNITNSDFDVSTDLERYKIINFLYGYTFGAQSDSTPMGKRTWILGDFIHSEPRVVDYVNSSGQLVYRFVILGANDGLLHVFLDYPATLVLGTDTFTAGDEIWAFVPPDLLARLKEFEHADPHIYMVDGAPNLFVDRDPAHKVNGYYAKTIVFGERRGGRSYWALNVSEPDPSLWTVKWHILGGASGVTTPVTQRISELGQTWNKPFFAKIQTGSATYKDVVIFAGGYDPLEDGFPENFVDDDHDGAWDAGETFTDTNGGTANVYDLFNPGADTMGRGIFVVDVVDGTTLFSAVYGDADGDGDETEDVKTGLSQVYCKMMYCFPADVSVVSLSKQTLLMYVPDIYGQMWKITYNYRADTLPYNDNASTKWKVKRIFLANAGSDMPTGNRDAFLAGPSLVSSDTGRKMFYGPDLSLYGNEWTYKTVLYFGTGDRAHPRYAMISNRFYVVADYDGNPDVTDETDLLNLTCNELDSHADADGDGTLEIASGGDDIELREDLKEILKNQYPSQSRVCRGWYRVLDKQGDCISGMASHRGEKMLSQPTLYFKNVYFTTYQPVFDDPCNPNGNARIYALEYSYGTAAFNYYLDNDTDEEVKDIRDTFQTITNASIPSGVRVVTRGGHSAGLISAGGAVSGVGQGQGTTIPGPAGGVTQMLWKTQ